MLFYLLRFSNMLVRNWPVIVTTARSEVHTAQLTPMHRGPLSQVAFRFAFFNFSLLNLLKFQRMEKLWLNQ